MVGTSGEKESDSSMGKLCEILSKILEQPKVVSGVVKYAIEPNPVKLSGPENYVSWARQAKLILSAHGYEKLLIATDGEEGKGSGTDTKQINDRVLVWLLGSMESAVREQVETMETVAEVWSALETQFSGKTNKMQATRVMHELLHLKQGARSVTEYACELKKLYRDLHYYHPFEPADKKDVAIHHTWFQSFVGKIFLDGLNEEFDLRRQLIFSKAEWPGLDDIISSVLEEETRLAQSKASNSRETGDRAALSMQNRRFAQSLKGKGSGKLKCDHCGDERHTIDRCFKLHGFPPGWKKEKFQRGGGHSANLNKANHTTSELQSQVVDAHALEEFESKLKISDGLSPAKGSSTADSSFHATSQGDGNWENSWDWDYA